MSYKYDYLVFIGRFQPFHLGHLEVLETALTLAERVIVVVGSADQPRSAKNPFNASERASMIIAHGPADGVDIRRVRIGQVRDCSYNDLRWATSVQQAVGQHILNDGWRDKTKIGIIGHHKDTSSFYLDLFPQWEAVEHPLNEIVSSTDLRALYFEGKNLKFLQSLVSPTTYNALERFRTTTDYKQLVLEYEWLLGQKKKWSPAPYPPTFVTTDAIVVQSGHILMIQRADGAFGANQWALPGGYLGQNELIVDGMIRELREETRLKVPPNILKGSIKNVKVFDHPGRSQRGRIITHAFHIELNPGPLPVVKGSDDAKDARWFEISEILNRWNELFEDHGDIISITLGV